MARRITLTLTKRKDGMYCKYIDGKMHYFGEVGCTEADATKELLDFLRFRANGVPQPEAREDVPLHEIANRFLADARGRVQPATYADYKAALKSFAEILGRDVLNSQLTAAQFHTVRVAWSKRFGAVRLGNQIQSVRTMFQWAVYNLIIDRVPMYGNRFDKPSATERRVEEQAKIEERGHRKFSTDEIDLMLRAAAEPLRTFILLGLNAGMYSVDISDLQWEEIKRDGELWIVDRIRVKTQIPQRFPMWPEVAIRFAAMARGHGRIFSTSHSNAWNNREKHVDSIALVFRRLQKRIGIRRDGVGFGSLRHTHISAINDHPHRTAAEIVRGHVLTTIVKHYDIPAIDKLKSITDLARERLISPALQAAMAVVS
jgi:integrase